LKESTKEISTTNVGKGINETAEGWPRLPRKTGP